MSMTEARAYAYAHPGTCVQVGNTTLYVTRTGMLIETTR